MILGNYTGGVLMGTFLYLANYQDQSMNNTLEDFYHLPIGADTDINKPRCYGVYGCFPLTYPWTTETRPNSVYPQSPSKINPHYPVFTKLSKYIPSYLDLNDPEETRNSGINPKGDIYVIVHGYIESGDRPWIQDMVNALLDEDKSGTASVIVVDWGDGSSPPYTQAVANIRLLGVITAHIIHMVYEELKLPDLDRVHMLGHSLGAHLSGYTGFVLQHDFGLTIGRITGMDPAEPLFTDTEPIVRLDSTDAKYVDVIHTDARPFSSGGLGMKAPIGHVDFYPNGGYDNPGCNGSVNDHIRQEKGSLFWGFQSFLGCNHVRSYQFMIESIRSKCTQNAISCESYERFRSGNCFDCNQNEHFCYRFGLKSIYSYEHLKGLGRIIGTEPQKVYLMHTLNDTYCKTHYKITLRMSASKESIIHGGEVGIMSIVVHSNSSNVRTEKMNFSEEPVYYEPMYKYSFVVNGRDVDFMSHATLSWEYKANPLNPLTWRILSAPRVYVDHIILESLDHRKKLKLCPMLYYPVVADTPNLFKEEFCNVNYINKQ